MFSLPRPALQFNGRPRPPLLGPALVPRDLAERPLAHRLDPVDRLEGKGALLKVGRELHEVEDLRDPGAREAELPGGADAVSVVAAVDAGLEVVRAGQHVRDSRWPTDLGRRRGWRLLGEGPGAAFADPEQAARDDALPGLGPAPPAAGWVSSAASFMPSPP